MNSKAQINNTRSREIIFSENAPLPLGTYSQAVRAGETIYLSAQTPVEPKSNDVLATDFEGQLVQTLDNLKAMAEACGGSLADVVKVNAFITDINEFPTLNRVMERYFSKPYPARTTSGASALARGTLVAIDAIMVV
ncbi:Rid family detoxifying hydrolase [Pseudomonas sp. NPDC007930]|uniref:Rid family detoxifying hydrolase n=1 Tax=Pseudomonas sp. NPDC007930 TaxID=3364417 RepID=UPI0036E41107